LVIDRIILVEGDGGKKPRTEITGRGGWKGGKSKKDWQMSTRRTASVLLPRGTVKDDFKRGSDQKRKQ